MKLVEERRSQSPTLSILAVLILMPGCRTSASADDRDETVVAQQQQSSGQSVSAQATDSLQRALREYTTAQEAYFADSSTYAAEMRQLREHLSETNPDIVTTVVTSSHEGHSAVARVREQSGGPRFDTVCGVAIRNAAPPLLDGAASGEITCRSANEGPVRLASPAGLLLGITGYRTLWIVFDRDSAAVMAAGPGLLAPREDGFWLFDRVEDARGLGMVVAESLAHPGHRDTVFRWPETIDPNDYETLRDSIEFVGSRHLGYSQLALRPDDIRPDRYDGFGSHHTVGPDLMPVEPDALVPPQRLAALRDEEQYCNGMGSWSWTIVRAPGRWLVQPFYNTGTICGFGAGDARYEPNRNIVGHPPVSLDVVRLVVPYARDAVLSPRRDAIVAIAPDSVYAFTVSATAFGPPRAVAAARGEVVMAEWALARHVQRWTDEIPSLLDHAAAEGR